MSSSTQIHFDYRKPTDSEVEAQIRLLSNLKRTAQTIFGLFIAFAVFIFIRCNWAFSVRDPEYRPGPFEQFVLSTSLNALLFIGLIILVGSTALGLCVSCLRAWYLTQPLDNMELEVLSGFAAEHIEVAQAVKGWLRQGRTLRLRDLRAIEAYAAKRSAEIKTEKEQSKKLELLQQLGQTEDSA